MQEKSEAVREQLLDCAIRHFSEKGYAATNLMEVAADAGVSRGPLYYYFSNKADLYRASVSRVIELQKAAYSRILIEGRPILETLREDYLYCLEDKGLFSRIGTGGKDEPDISSEYLAFSRWLIERKYSVLNAAKARGELAADCDLSELITFIYIYYHGVLQVQNMAKDTAGFSRTILDNSVHFFLDIIQNEFIHKAV